MTISNLIDKAAAELVEELLAATKPGGEKWFFVVRRKMAALAIALKERRKK